MAKKMAHHFLSNFTIFTIGHSTTTLRASVYSLLGSLGEPCAVKHCTDLFASHMAENGNPIHPDIRSAVYATVASHGDMGTFEQLMSLYMATDAADERVRLLASLGKFPNEHVRGMAQHFAISVSVRLVN